MPSEEQIKVLVTYRILLNPENCRVLKVNGEQVMRDESVTLTEEEFKDELKSLERDMRRQGSGLPYLRGGLIMFLAFVLTYLFSPTFLFLGVIAVVFVIVSKIRERSRHDRNWQTITRQFQERA